LTGPRYFLKKEAVRLIVCSPAFVIYPLSPKHKAQRKEEQEEEEEEEEEEEGD